MRKVEWSKQEQRIVGSMRAAGCTFAEIGERLGKTPAAVKCFVYRHPETVNKAYVPPLPRSHTPESKQLCWNCKKANGSGNCEWANSLQPVPGWSAEEAPARATTKGGGVWYAIYGCPKFAKG